MNGSLKELALRKIADNEDVLFHWDVIAINWEPSEAKEFLQMIMEQYITVRGFSFVNGFMELYKQSNKKTTENERIKENTWFKAWMSWWLK